MSEMVERAAQAAAQQYGCKWDDLPEENPVDNGELDRQHFRDTARDIIASMREPTDAMLEAGRTAKYPVYRDGVDRRTPAMWQAMIDAALDNNPHP